MGQGIRPFKVLLRQLLKITDFIYVIDIVILAIYRTSEKRTLNIKKIFNKRSIKNKSLIIFIIILILFFQIYITNNMLGNRKPLVLYNENTSSFINVYGIIPLYFYEYYTFTLFSEDQIVENEPSPPPEEELSGERVVKRDHNIIVIQVESLDNKILDYEYEGKEITPFLNELKDESVYFDNFYAQHINGSFDAEFSFLTSIYPINKNYGFKVNDLSQFDSLVKILNKKNYRTLAFHGNDKEFFHREKAFPELGFDKFYSKENFTFENRKMNMEESVFGINDYDFFLQSFDYLKDSENPFFAFLITVSSHTPFDTYPPQESIDDFSEINNPLVRDYFNSMSFVDKSLEMFFDKIKTAGLEENTLIMIYSDHNAGINKEDYNSDKKFVMEKNVKTPENVPLLIVYPELENNTLNKEGTTTDLAPTILDILGVKKKPEEFLGSSLLSEEDSPVLFLHENPLILFKGQLFSRINTGIEKIGYTVKQGNKEINLPNKKDIIDLIEYMRGIIYKRRVDS
ncbi:MAG: LTA synthase family protein [Halanaerobiales bacterium]